MEQSGNIPVFNIPGILFGNIHQNFIGNFFKIFWEYFMGMFHENSTNIYLSGEEQDVGQDKINITKKKMMRVLRKMQNWKTSGPDNLQGYWLKSVTTLHGKLVVYFQDSLGSGMVRDSAHTKE